jgi:protein phosphatase
MLLQLPELSLVVLVGPSGSGKSTFARKHFKPTEILSSDQCRGWVRDDENDQSATNDAFEVLHLIASKRLAAGKLTVIDATNVQAPARKTLLDLAKKYHFLPAAIVFDLPEKICQERNQSRADRQFGPHVIRNQIQQLRKSWSDLKQFRTLHVLDSLEAVDSAEINRTPMWNNRRYEHGPFDIIGDIHGCYDELEELLLQLNYSHIPGPTEGLWKQDRIYQPPEGRKAVFLGDLVDRGPRNLDCLKLVHNMVQAGFALCVPGNHDVKLQRFLHTGKANDKHGFDRTRVEIEAIPLEDRERFNREMSRFIDKLIGHYVLDDGKLVVAHAGMKEEMQGRGSGAVRQFALYGETTGEIDDFGLPVRLNWAAEYRGSAMVVHGHTPVVEPQRLNRVICIDTGCVFGGKLTAYRYPEMEFVSVPAKMVYSEPIRPLMVANPTGLSLQQQADDVLDLADVTGKRILETRLRSQIMIREEHSTAALEVMSRFAVNPRWLIYLPPTMSPCSTSKYEGFLEHPSEAFDDYRGMGLGEVICERKHMGSRAVVILGKDEGAIRRRFGIENEGRGMVYTRTGRRFFNDLVLETSFLDRIAHALTESHFWEKFSTDWVCFDGELMPWSAKAQELIRNQYAAVGAAATTSMKVSYAFLDQAFASNADPAIGLMLHQHQLKQQSIQDYIRAYRNYCWDVISLDDLQFAPFHLLATEGKSYFDQPHTWHLEQLASISAVDPTFVLRTESKLVNLQDPGSIQDGIQWWLQLTESGGEGMVIKPLDFIASGKKGLLQPAIKCRGREYLRIIYGPEYLLPENLSRLRQRNLGTKRSLALREFSLGVESLERFTNQESLRRVHECVFAVLALESEPVDSRL